MKELQINKKEIIESEEKRIWYLYLEKVANFLEENKTKIYGLIEKLMSEERKKRNLESETEKEFCRYAIGDIEMRITEYHTTFRAFQKNPNMLEKYFFLQESIHLKGKPIYDGNTGEEFKQILFDIEIQKEKGEIEEKITEFLLKKYKAFPCNCLIHEPLNLNYLPGFVAAKAINKAVEDFYSAIDI